MRPKRKYFVLNKALDFNRCFLQNMFFEKNRLKIDTGKRNGTETCAMISRILDSEEHDMQWHQFLCSMQNERNTAFTISIYAANSLVRQIKDKEEQLDEILFDEGLSLTEKKAIFHPYLQKTMTNADDILLHEIKGRYLWFIFETMPQEGQHLEIEKIKIFFPGQSWLRYLPEFYQVNDENQFFERFLAVFQTMYEALNDSIWQMPYLLDIDCAEKEFLEWLAKWLDIAESYMWTKEQMRRLLKQAVTLYRMRGTRQAVLAFVQLYTGDSRVFIVENFQVANQGKEIDEKLLHQLYGNDPYKFQVIVREENIPSVREYQTLTKIIKEVKPAYMELELVVLKPYIFLDRHTYMGINSILGEYRALSLDGASMLSFSVLGNTVLESSHIKNE